MRKDNPPLGFSLFRSRVELTQTWWIDGKLTMNGLTNAWMIATDVLMYGWLDGWKDWMDGRMDGWLIDDGWMDGWMRDGWWIGPKNKVFSLFSRACIMCHVTDREHVQKQPWDGWGGWWNKHRQGQTKATDLAVSATAQCHWSGEWVKGLAWWCNDHFNNETNNESVDEWQLNMLSSLGSILFLYHKYTYIWYHHAWTLKRQK